MKCKCGHLKSQHIYEEGACRPGFVCETQCQEYIEEESLDEKYQAVLDRDIIAYGQSFEKVTFDAKTGTLTKIRIDPLTMIKEPETK